MKILPFCWRGRASAAVLLAFGFLLTPPGARAVLLDWDTLTWVPGFVNSYDIDPVHPGSDVTISILGDTGYMVANYPQLSTELTGGLAPAQQSLTLRADFPTRSENLVVAIDFLYDAGVQNVNYTLFDVDYENASNKRDSSLQVGLLAGADDANRNLLLNYLHTLTPPYGSYDVDPSTITGSAANAIEAATPGTLAKGMSAAANNSSAGNVTVDYGNSVLRSAMFRLDVNFVPDANPDEVHIALSDISFTPVPEAGTLAAGAVACLLGYGWFRRRMTGKDATTGA